jgi:hypothetical protein
VVWLSVWTGYRSSDNAQKRVARAVQLSTGEVLWTKYFTRFDDGTPLSGAESSPAAISAVPGFDSSAGYHDYRIVWSADHVTFSLRDGGRDLALWDYHGPATRIPQRPSSFLVNLWHTGDWAPPGRPSALKAPAAPLTAAVDQVTLPGTP